jgi:hypothetical protein
MMMFVLPATQGKGPTITFVFSGPFASIVNKDNASFQVKFAPRKLLSLDSSVKVED